MSKNAVFKARIGKSSHDDEQQAVQDLFEQINQPFMESVIFFCSSKYNLDRLGDCLREAFPCSVIGCTTAGEITAEGYDQGTIAGASLGGDTDTGAIKTHSHLIRPLSELTTEDYEALASSVQDELVISPGFNSRHMFGLLLVDGMSMLEELVIAHIHTMFREVPVIGGSAGDDLHFDKTSVYYEGRFLSDAAVFTLVETTLPFVTFKTQHFVPNDKKLVITEADPEHRRVVEINGEPAAKAYCDILGLQPDRLTPMTFSNHPVILRIGGMDYVRSIQKVNKDGSLSFYCAIDNGLVLTLAKGVDLVANLQNQLVEINKEIPSPELIIGYDCILRRLEAQEKDLMGDVRDVVSQEKFLGFSTYGEQFNAIHVNQTLTGVAIGGTP